MTGRRGDAHNEPDSGRVALALRPGHAVMEYSIERTLGGGGFGITYLARDLNLSLPVALKEYLPADLATRGHDGSVRSLGDESSESNFKWGLDRFIDEARALATFNHPNIVRVLRYFTANGTAYIVMEYQSGYSLNNWAPRHMPLGRGDLLKLVLPLLDGLELVHQAGFLHRDIKPDNIFVRGDGSPVLIDFGAARRTTAGQDMTKIITPGFAPFEQYHSKGNQGPWTDLYSLAGVMYWLVSGNKPMESASRLKRDDMVPAAQSDHHHLIGEPILSAIDWALNLEEERRPQSAAEFRARLVGDAMPQTRSIPRDDVTIALTRQLGPRVDSRGSLTTAVNSTDPQRGNVVCTVLFLDIIAYSKVSVSEQYELKTRFNQLIATKLAGDPENERITLDTGDGAAICFMGDPEEVLRTALDIRRSLAVQDRLRVRMGLHIGPVRILTDLNGRGNVIGDGINAAQRVMSFADEKSLLVSRAFYDVVSCLSDNGEKAFRYIGGQPDKHGRVHELYEVVLDPGASLLIDPTQYLHAPPLEDAQELDSAALASLEQELTHHLGPLAPVLVRKARGRVSSIEQLRELLAQSIAEPAHREAFRKGLEIPSRDAGSATRRTRPPEAAPATTRVARPADAPLTNTRVVPSKGSPTMTVSEAGPSTRTWISDEALEAIQKHLAKAVGPVARVLIKSEMKKVGDFAGLTDALALHIDNPQARAQFVSFAQGLRAAPKPELRPAEKPSSARRDSSLTATNPYWETPNRTEAATDRILATVLFTDICDSTVHASRLGDRRWRETLEQHHALVRAELARFRGREIDTAGDGFFALFDGPARAVQCACSIRDQVRQLGIEIRAGLHTGEVETIGEKASGIAVHIGARVAAIAEASEVLVSSTVKDLIAGSNIRLIDYGDHELKGLSGTWHLYVVFY
jgi:serine/threonine protein kinase